jgi:hypothetical protein
MLADGGEAIGDINVLRHQDQVLGPVASAPTGVARPGRADSRGVEADRGGPGQGPPSRVGPASQAAGRPGR